jgi:hypothetical protein
MAQSSGEWPGCRMTFREGLPVWGKVEEVGAMEVLERTFVAGTRREAAADGDGRRAEPPERGGASMPLNEGGLSLGGLDKRAGGGAILGVVSLAFDDRSCACSGSCILISLPLLSFGATSFCGFNEAGNGSSCTDASKPNVGLPSQSLSLFLSFSTVFCSSTAGDAGRPRYLYRRYPRTAVEPPAATQTISAGSTLVQESKIEYSLLEATSWIRDASLESFESARYKGLRKCSSGAGKC